MKEGMNSQENEIEKREYERKTIVSNLEKSDGTQENFSIKLDKDGKPPLVVFEDIDKTLLHLEPTYIEIRKAMWPDAVEKYGVEKVNEIHLAGFRLGTMWRELHRMNAIFNEGKTEWIDPEVYEKEFLSTEDGKNIDSPGNKLHEECDVLLEKFDNIAASTVERQAKENPEFFEEAKMQPTYKLNALYKRLGIPVVGMTANPKKFALALCKYAGLSENFIECATDTDVQGTKEYKMIWLMKKLEEKGIKIPYDKLLVIGDSPVGDVGSAQRLIDLVKSEHPEIKASGLVIISNEEERLTAAEKLKNATDINIHTFDYTKVPKDKDGNPQLFSQNRKDFMTEINIKKNDLQ